MKLIRTKSELVKLLDEQQFVEDTCLQIAKDLGGLVTTNFNIHLDLDKAILDQLKTIVVDVLKTLSAADIQQFLYRVDINEQKMNDFFNQSSDYQKLAEEVIIREAQKVYLRRRFKS